ncbi:hypothetical protein [Parapedobacter sp.]
MPLAGLFTEIYAGHRGIGTEGRVREDGLKGGLLPYARYLQAYRYPKGSASWSNLRAVLRPSSCCFAAENSTRHPRGKLVHPQGHRSSLGAVSEQSGITLAKTVAHKKT